MPLVPLSAHLVDWALSPKAREASYSLMMRSLIGEDYGLVDLEAGRALVHPTDTRFMASSLVSLEQPIGVFRVTHNCDPLGHSNVFGSAERYLRSGNRVLDVGAYFSVRGQARVGCFLSLLRVLTQEMRRTNFDGIYIQVQPRDLVRFRSLGFVACTKPFMVRGWSSQWVAMIMSISAIDRALGITDGPVSEASWPPEQEALNPLVLGLVFGDGTPA